MFRRKHWNIYTLYSPNRNRIDKDKELQELQVTRVDKDGEEFTKHICYILQFTDSARFMASSL